DIGRADRAEQLAFRTGFRGDRKLEVLQRLAPFFSGRQMLASSLLELVATSLKARYVVLGGESRLALGQEEVPTVAGTDLYGVPDVAEVGNLLKQNNVHCGGLNADRCTAAGPGSARA